MSHIAFGRDEFLVLSVYRGTYLDRLEPFEFDVSSLDASSHVIHDQTPISSIHKDSVSVVSKGNSIV